MSIKSSERKFEKSITLDFDGVIHPYNQKFSHDVCSDPPFPVTLEAIKRIRGMGFKVYVFSTRCETPHGVQVIRDYLKEHNIEVDDVVTTKERSKVYVDDRAYRFTGNWDRLLKLLSNEESYAPHNKKKEGHAIFDDLAAKEHEVWAGWTEYMLKTLKNEMSEAAGFDTIFEELPCVERWRRQIQSSFEDLSEKEKESDRKQVVKRLDLYEDYYNNY
jgi:hypothetical protein